MKTEILKHLTSLIDTTNITFIEAVIIDYLKSKKSIIEKYNNIDLVLYDIEALINDLFEDNTQSEEISNESEEMLEKMLLIEF